ncbi:hypothetical protein [Burkholderia sp. Bp8963]|uniref:hypothetical protein n=1 Tax=Burkholderia sp. Bp8963 TaxID=2184547 RepID=UPI000F59EDAF|nr:hypothetical protein [Burkholderia sp. Bp8963]
MKNIALLIIIYWLISACAIDSVGELLVRSPKQFLSDVKVVADSGDLENVEFVSRWLRVEYRRGARGAVYDSSGQSVDGYGVDMTRHASSKEYSRDGSFYYGIYQPNGGDFYRARISLPINSDVICVAPCDFIGVFRDVERYPIAHGARWGYVYDNKATETRVAFSVGDGGCLYRIGILKNQAWR